MNDTTGYFSRYMPEMKLTREQFIRECKLSAALQELSAIAADPDDSQAFRYAVENLTAADLASGVAPLDGDAHSSSSTNPQTTVN
ncbi:MAG: hypothetical protein MSG64_20850 [Pyrinomonadaceae bacterium MAG19_C2-C3]|nr:hypothetical protein [Pyrinomonadaceae bacterium MAG19_C2-C3]